MSEIIIKNDKIRKGMIFMDEATLERRLHLNMTLIGGFMVGYGVINRHDILGSAQTGVVFPYHSVDNLCCISIVDCDPLS